MSFFLCGLSFVVDQRAGLLILIPALTFTLTTKKFLSLGYIFFFLPILAFLIYLNKNHALIPFYEQTLLYPSKYRSGSSSLLELLKNGILANKYLYLMSPILLISGMVGFLQILHKAILHKRNSSLMPIIFCFIPCFVMPFFGNRDYEYYSIPWLVLLSISTALSPALFSKRIVKLRNFYSIILCLPVFISLRDLSVELGKGYAHANSGDGVHEVVSFLKNKMSEDDTIYVWGYRLDIYVYLKKLSPFPDAAQLMIHPDSQILDEEARRAHVFDKYEERFLEDFKANLPTFLVLFDTTQAPQVSSRANALVRRVSQTNYRLVFKSRTRDFIENDITFEVYERHSKVLGTDSGIQ